MRERNIDTIFASIMMAISFIQIYGLLYHEKIEFPFRDDLHTTITNICSLIRIYPLLQFGGDGVYYWMASYIYIVVLVLYVLQIIYVDYSIKMEKFYFNFPIKILRYANSLIFWIVL